MISLAAPLVSIKIAPRFLEKLERLGIQTVRDLLWHFPVRYEDFSRIYSIEELEPGQQATVQGMVRDIRSRKTWQKQMSIVEATIEDQTASIRAVWFNQPYLRNSIHPERLYNFSGKVSISKEGELYFSHPLYEAPTGPHANTKHTGRLVPIYPETRGLTSRGIRFLVEPILERIAPKEWLPEDIRTKEHIPEIRDALKDIHFPASLEAAEQARERFAFEELFLLQIANEKTRTLLSRKPASSIDIPLEWLRERIIPRLPFELTRSQKEALWSILKDMSRTHPMNRLLQGDVGSGKTVVAALAALGAAHAGFQSAIMAPTEILARQHYATVKKLFLGFDEANQPSVGLIAGGEAKVFYDRDLESDISTRELAAKTESGNIDLLIGTHALI